jgi:hypothetical protein
MWKGSISGKAFGERIVIMLRTKFLREAKCYDRLCVSSLYDRISMREWLDSDKEIDIVQNVN